MPLAQLNIRLPPDLIAKVKADALRQHLPVEQVARAIMEAWSSSFTLTERAKHYSKTCEPKILGRPVT